MRPILRTSARAEEITAARSIMVNNPVIAGREEWKKDNIIDAFKTSNLDANFSCNCGHQFVPNNMFRCACGTTWNAFIIGDNEKTAGKVTKIVRSVPEYRERILATKIKPKKRMAGWVKSSLENGVPSFVRSANEVDGGDVAPTPLDGSVDDRGVVPPAQNTTPDASPVTNLINPSSQQSAFSKKKIADGGWPASNVNVPNAATSKPAQSYTAPAASTPATTPIVTPPKLPAPKTVAPAAMAPATNNTVPAVAPINQTPPAPLAGMIPGQPGVGGQIPAQQGNPAQQQPLQTPRTYKMAFSEEEYKMGWALAAADAPLPARQLHASFIEGYADHLSSVVLADNAPGYDTIAPAFAPADPDKNNSMSDYTDTMKGKTLPDYRDDLKNKIDSDNNAGQHRSDDSMTDLSGWKSSALLAELARRQAKK